MANVAEIALYDDYVIEYDLKRKNATTRAVEAVTPATGLSGWLSLTDGGTEIHATLKVGLTEASGKLGSVNGLLQQADLLTHLAALVGTTIYEIVDKPGDTRRSTPLMVVTILRAA